jgi:hypothetical protein
LFEVGIVYRFEGHILFEYSTQNKGKIESKTR